MLTNINRTKGLEVIGADLENDENKEYYLLVKVQPVAEEFKGDEVTVKVAVDNGLAYHVSKTEAQYLISQREQS